LHTKTESEIGGGEQKSPEIMVSSDSVKIWKQNSQGQETARSIARSSYKCQISRTTSLAPVISQQMKANQVKTEQQA